MVAKNDIINRLPETAEGCHKMILALLPILADEQLDEMREYLARGEE